MTASIKWRRGAVAGCAFVALFACSDKVTVSIDGEIHGTLYVDEKPVGSTPWRGALNKGRHHVRVVGPCDSRIEKQVTLEKDTALRLSPQVELANVRVDVRDVRGDELQGATILSAFGEHAPRTDIRLPVCATSLKVEADKHATVLVALDLQAGSSTTFVVRLPPGNGHLRYIEAGALNLGTDSSPHLVDIGAFALDERPVSKDDYRACVNARACPPLPAGCERGGMFGVDCLEYEAAAMYCRFVGSRLPTAHELRRAHERVAEAPVYEYIDRVIPSGWALDGALEYTRRKSESVYRAKQTHDDTSLAFRCALSVEPDEDRSQDAPCFASCDGCAEARDGLIDERIVFDVDKEGKWTRTTRFALTEPEPLHTAPFASVLPYLQAKLLADQNPPHKPGDKLETLATDPWGKPLALKLKDTERTLFVGYDDKHRVEWLWVAQPETKKTVTLSYLCRESTELSRECPRPDGRPTLGVATGFGECRRKGQARWYPTFHQWDITRHGESEFVFVEVGFRYTNQGIDARTESPVASVSIATDDERTLSPLGTFDFDGDRHPELMVLNRTSTETRLEDKIYILTYRNGAVASYFESTEFAESIAAIEDFDKDGRPDLLTEAPTLLDNPFVYACRGGFLTLWHSLKDGTFSHSDSVARRYLKKQCPRHPGTLLFKRPKETQEALTRLVCMWLWGDPEAELRARIDAEWPLHGCTGEDDHLNCVCTKEDFETFLTSLVARQPQLLAPAASQVSAEPTVVPETEARSEEQ